MIDEFKMFIAVCNWEYDHLESIDDRIDVCVWQAIAARLLGWDR